MNKYQILKKEQGILFYRLHYEDLPKEEKARLRQQINQISKEIKELWDSGMNEKQEET